MSKTTKKFFAGVAAMIMLLYVMAALLGCSQNPDNYTEEDHIQRVTDRIQEQYMNNSKVNEYYMNDDGELTGFKVYPLYNESDKLAYFLVEFEPRGFLNVRINSETSAFPACGANSSMYSSDSRIRIFWQRYTVDESNNQPWPDIDKCWEIDENGEFVYYYKSHFSVAGIEDARRYLLTTSQGGPSYIPAVKQGDKYLNLISMQEMDIEYDGMSKKHAVSDIYFVSASHFDL